ncbi:MAG: adenylate/guanylate cyclase domain-containing protein [Nocardioidaceae bacterium]
MTCTACGTELPPGARFCFSCGATQASSRCASCGEELVAGARFCISCGAAQPPRAATVSAAHPVATRRVTSVLFGDLVGFTSLSETRDQEEVRELLSRYFDGCRAVIARYGGTVEKFIGDAVMAVWGVPTAHEDDAERGVRAGLELVQAVAAMGDDLGVSALAMRVGIVTGEVAVTIGAEQQGMVAGDAVNTAARVQSVAQPGQVWVDETTRLLTASAITYVDVGSHRLKGKLETVPLWSVRAVVAAIGGIQRADGLEAPLVGRDRELRLVKELFHHMQEVRQPSLLVVDGEAGVGKSRVAWELEKYVDGLSDIVRWHSGRCLAYGEGVAFFALAEAVRTRLRAARESDETEDDVAALLASGVQRYVPDPDERAWLEPRVGALLGIGSVGTFSREDLFEAWTKFFERVGDGSYPVVLVVDDAHHADDGLLQFIEHLLTAGSFACFVVLLTRPGLLETHPALATNRRSTVVHLAGLGDRDMAALLDGLVSGLPEGVRDELVARAEGMPLFAVETVRALIDRDLVVPRGGQYVLANPEALDLDQIGAPASLQALVAARLDTLNPAQRSVVSRASVLGGTFTSAEIRALCADVADLEAVLAGLVRQQILTRETSRFSADYAQYAFVQTVVRQVAYASLSRRDRKATHLAVVAAHETNQEEDAELAPIIAQHYLDAIEAMPGEPDVTELTEAAISNLRAAAARAESLGAPTEAAGHLRTALAHAVDAAERATLQSKLAWALVHCGQYHAAAEVAAAAAGFFDQVGNDVDAGLAACAHAEALCLGSGDNAGAVAIAQPRWEALIGRADAVPVLLALNSTLTQAKLRVSEDIRELVEERMRLADLVEDMEALTDCFNTLGVHYIKVGVPSLSRILIQSAADMARAHHYTVPLARSLSNLSSDRLGDDLVASETLGREAVSAATASGVTVWISYASVNLALALFGVGGWDEALDVMAAAAPFSASDNKSALASIRISIAQARGEDLDAGWDEEGDAVSDDPVVQAWRDHADAQRLRGDGHPREALAKAMSTVEKAHQLFGTWDDFWHFFPTAASLALDRSDDSAVTRLLELTSSNVSRVLVGVQGHRAWLRARYGEGDGPEATEARYREALAKYETWGSPVYIARAAADFGLWLAGQGRAAEAEDRLGEVRATFTRFGAVAWLEQIEARLTSAG